MGEKVIVALLCSAALLITDCVRLTPKIGEFYSSTYNDVLPDKDPNGELYGFEDDLTEGCSVWCAIMDYQTAAESTSHLTPQGEFTYEAENILTGNRMSAWVEGVEGYGIGESVSISKYYDNGSDKQDSDCFFFPGLCIVNGMAKNEDAWKNNSRAKTLKMYFNEEYVCDLKLFDTMKPQYISLSGLNLSSKNKETSTFRFEIAEVYPGDQYDDTAITGIEIQVFTENH